MLKKVLSQNHRCFSTWFDAVMTGTGEHVRDRHSKLLAKNNVLYQLEVHDVKPGHMKEYTQNSKQILPTIHECEEMPARLFGQFSVAFGNLDKIYTIWRYEDGYKDLEKSYMIYRTKNIYKQYEEEQAKFINHRSSQVCFQFSFWPEYIDNSDGGFFEIRSYSLRPGSLYEWGNAWAQGIKIRDSDAVMGLATQVGTMNTVHHIWRYRDLVERAEERGNAWQSKEWARIVKQTVPLITDLNVDILVPTDFSPLQ